MKKLIISESILFELNLSDKNKTRFLSKGNNQYAFNSLDGEKVVKIGRSRSKEKETLQDFEKRPYNNGELYELQEMQKYPKYFPIIYKISKDFVVMEKLNAVTANEHFNAIQKIIDNYSDGADFADFLYDYKDCRSMREMPEGYQEVYKAIMPHLTANRMFGVCRKFMELVKNIADLKLFDIDVSPSNFAYDKANNLKMIDV